ncbi:hypothetical protein M441DRAFT_358387 [Trichoderma asperellum CBS 433.97]|uniref:Uncharacterized protein n=1 Tax=Trichoderma asperellum (strain ATCC 204424 / CBS 433.97 / NBRC 101777) TaxID=1042311 RepID=A0A2T3ZD83_TRIA4|nr:hypothetical protein M441DRAFT_358387 [Trichoderma asperellum CBS 433.97]PTB42766.1 hypothetical protein M441DRAFT_358387 [Trichoderma asperellum CBS 433.97]
MKELHWNLLVHVHRTEKADSTIAMFTRDLSPALFATHYLLLYVGSSWHLVPSALIGAPVRRANPALMLRIKSDLLQNVQRMDDS